MQDVEEGGDSIASRLANLRLLEQGVVEKRGGILLLLASIATCVFTLRLLLCCRHARDVETHLHELILACAGLLALAAGATKVSIGASIVGVLRQRHLHGNLVPSRQIGVANLRVWDLESRSVLHTEGDLGL